LDENNQVGEGGAGCDEFDEGGGENSSKKINVDY
jgi:hypothetical protein